MCANLTAQFCCFFFKIFGNKSILVQQRIVFNHSGLGMGLQVVCVTLKLFILQRNVFKHSPHLHHSELGSFWPGMGGNRCCWLIFLGKQSAIVLIFHCLQNTFGYFGYWIFFKLSMLSTELYHICRFFNIDQFNFCIVVAYANLYKYQLYFISRVMHVNMYITVGLGLCKVCTVLLPPLTATDRTYAIFVLLL